jgi:crotonobetainyl-CoA:carnitine CoA-transferase CaiB-like acyl-CoA transferase
MRVLELATGIAGPYAGRLLSMLGASVVKREAEGGDAVRRQPLDSRAVPDPSPLDVHLNTGKRRISQAVPLERALGWADVVIDGRVASEVGGAGMALRAGAVLVTTSPWGFGGPPARIADELLVQARSGAMSTTGDPDGPPLRFPGFQAQYFAGAYAAAAALLALRIPGCRHIDVPWVRAIASGVEAGWARNLQADLRDAPGGAHQLDVYPSGALPCADGFVVPGTIRPADWVAQCGVYGQLELVGDERFRSRRRRGANHQELWRNLEPWYRGRTRAQIFEAALGGGWALGMVLGAHDLLDDAHVAARGFLQEVALPGGGQLRAATRPWIAPGVGDASPTLAAPGADDTAFSREPRTPRGEPLPRQPLARVRVLELTQAWAGPFTGRLLAALGAEVVKVESASRPDGWRGPEPFGLMAPHLGRDAGELSVEISSAYNTINRNKRHCAIDITTEDGRGVFLELVGRADVVIANLTARVLPNLGLDYAALRRANPGIILLNMPALGASGPFRAAAGYGTIVEGMGGFAALFGPPEAGARISQTYYPDPVAGLHASVAVLSMLERRDRTGDGGEIDLSHQEALWLQLGETLVAAAQGRDVERVGNRMPGTATSGVFRTRDDRWLAIASDVDCDDLAAESQSRSAAELLAALESRGAAATEVLHFAEARDDPLLRETIETVEHAVTGSRPYLRVPLEVDGRPLDTRSPAPLFGQDTHDVLAEWLSMPDDRIDRLVAGGAVGGAPDPERLRAFYRKRSGRA